MENKDINIRFAQETESEVILELIRGLAAYENMEDEVAATKEQIHETIFVNRDAEVLLAEYKEKIVGFALFFHTYSTFLGKTNIYLEDLFVKEEARGKGIGRLFFRHLAKIAIDKGYGRIEWCCLDWNQKSIEFYKHMGAEVLDDRRIYRISDDKFKEV